MRSQDGGRPDRLLPGEDPNTTNADQAARWNRAYRELIQAKDSLIGELVLSMAHAGPDAMAELESVDGEMLTQERDRFVRRLAFWHIRENELTVDGESRSLPIE